MLGLRAGQRDNGVFLRRLKVFGGEVRRPWRRHHGAGAVECIEGRVAYRDIQHARDHGVSGLVMSDGLFLPHDDKLHNLLTKAADLALERRIGLTWPRRLPDGQAEET
jgi:hypothetical protein